MPTPHIKLTKYDVASLDPDHYSDLCWARVHRDGHHLALKFASRT